MTEDKVVERLDRIIKLIVLAMTSGRPQIERIKLLSGVGCTPKEIAGLLGTTGNTVNVALAGLRKKQKGKNSRSL